MVIVIRVVVLAASIVILVIRAALFLAIVVMVMFDRRLTATSVAISVGGRNLHTSVRASRVRAMNTPLPMVTNLRFPCRRFR